MSPPGDARPEPPDASEDLGSQPGAPDDEIVRERGSGEPEPSAGTSVRDERSARELLQTLLGVVAPTAVLTALLYYFGWAVTSAQARVLSLDESAFAYTTRDYLLRSTGAILVPLIGLLLLGLIGVWAHTGLSGWVDSPDRRRDVSRLSRVLFLIGAVMLSAGIVGAFVPRLIGAIVPPLALALGVTSCAYAAFLRRRLRDAQRERETSPGPLLRTMNVMMVVLLVGLCLFWLIGAFADKVGDERARRAMSQLASRPSVTVYSTDRLHLDVAGVQETQLGVAGSAERYRYTGLKLLFWANGKYFLVSETWPEAANPTTIVLPDIPALRLEFSPAAPLTQRTA